MLFKCTKSVSLLLLCILAFNHRPANAAPVIYVNPDTGLDINDGLSTGASVRSLTMASTLVDNGGSVLVAQGSFMYNTTQEISGNFSIIGSGAFDTDTTILFEISPEVPDNIGIHFASGGTASGIAFKNIYINMRIQISSNTYTTVLVDGPASVTVDHAFLSVECTSVACYSLSCKSPEAIIFNSASLSGQVSIDSPRKNISIVGASLSSYQSTLTVTNNTSAQVISLSIVSSLVSGPVKLSNMQVFVQGSSFDGSYSGYSGDGGCFSVVNVDPPRSVSILDSNFTSCAALNMGGAILLENVTTPTVVSRCLFVACVAGSQGGAIAAISAPLHVNSSLFDSNTIRAERLDAVGGVAVYSDSQPLYVSRSRFVDNVAPSPSTGSGAIWVGDDVNINSCAFSGNSAIVGAIRISKGSRISSGLNASPSAQIVDSVLQDNVGQKCGAVGVLERSVAIFGSTFVGNMKTPSFNDDGFSSPATALCSSISTLKINNTIFRGNGWLAIGSTHAALSIDNGAITCYNVSFDSNFAYTGAGAVAVFTKGQFIDTGLVTFFNNSVTSDTDRGDNAQDIYVTSRQSGDVYNSEVLLLTPLRLSTPPHNSSINSITVAGETAFLRVLPGLSGSRNASFDPGQLRLVQSGNLLCVDVACTIRGMDPEDAAGQINLNSFPLVFVDLHIRGSSDAGRAALQIIGPSYDNRAQVKFQGNITLEETDKAGSILLRNADVVSTAALISTNPRAELFNRITLADSDWFQGNSVDVSGLGLHISGSANFLSRFPSRFMVEDGTSMTITSATIAVETVNVTASNVRVYSEPKRDGDPFAFKLLDNVAELHFDGDIVIGPGLFQGHLGESYPFAFSAPETLPTVSAGTVTVSLNYSSPNTELQVLVDGFNIWIYARRGAASSCGVPPRTNWIYCSEGITNVFSPLNITSNLTLGAPMTIQAGITIGSQSEVISITFDPDAGTWMDLSGCLAFNHEAQPVVFEVAFSPSSIPVIDGQSASYPISWNRSIISTAEQCPLNFTGLVSSGRVIPAAKSIDGQVCDFNTTSVQTSFLGLELQCGFFPRAPADPPLSSGVTPSVSAPGGAPISQSIQSSPTGAIVGGVIGAMVAVAAAILIFILLMRRSKRSNIKRGSDRDDADSTPLAPIAGSGGEIPSDLVDAVPAFQKSGAVKFVQFTDMTFMQELGKGSFGSVTLALLNGEFVAVKTVNAARDGTIKLLEKEAASFSAIKPHRNIVKFIGVFSEGEKSGIVMEFCPKGSLAVHAKRMRHNLSPYDLFKFGFGILEGMVVLASSGVVHCDLAGRNVLLDERFFTKVSDFGSSQRGTTQEVENTEDTLGPYKWQSPEAVKSHKFSEKSDVWSFGATMVEILTKREPYHGFKGSTLQLVEQIGSGATDPWRHLKESDPGLAASLPEWIEPVLVSCFTIDDSQRPTFREVRYQLSKLCPELKNMYEAEVDEADSVLNSDYQAVPSLSSGSAWTTSAPTETLEAPTSPAPELDSGGLKAIDVVRLNRLGEGSFGSVWLAKYQDQFVALKVLNVGNNKSEEIRREAGIMSTIAPHRNIIRLHGLITEESSELCIVMELAPKGSLEDYVKASRAAQQDIKEALLFKWCIGVARGMAHLSASHVIHRDLSARNVLLDSSLEPKIADFGLGRQVLDPNQETSTQTDVGPLRWFAPECFELKYSEKTDVWAFGCTLVELLTGDVPFPKLSAIETAVAVRDEERNALECVDVASTPPWMIATMKACFARDPKLRASFADLVKQLEEAATMIQEINDAEELIRKRRARRGQTIVGDR